MRLCLALTLAFGLTAGHLAWGQSATSGALSGSVRDPAAGPVANAAVALTNLATNQSFASVTDANGRYRFSLLPPGAYRVIFTAKGFKSASLVSATVDVAEAPILDATLDPGETTEQAQCKCQFSAGGSSTGTLVDQKTITSVPLTTRNFTQVLSMASGSAADVNNAGSLGRGTQSVNVNGNTSAGGFTLDGANAPTAVPNPDTISEFKIQTSQYDAGYGAQVPNTNMITRSGENEFHGNGWEFVRNDVFNANAFFRNATAQPKPNLKQNQYGGTLGGPIRRNRLFFFGSYQGTRQVNGLDPTSISNPILPPLKQDRSALALAAQFCPGNHLLANGQADSRYATFAGGKQLDCRNQTTTATAPINPVALALLQMKNADGSYLIPEPQTILTSGSNAGLGFSTYSLPSTYRESQYLLNSDYMLSKKHTLSGRVYIATLNQFRTFSSPNAYPGPAILPGDGTPQKLKGQDSVGTGKLSSVLNQRMVNEARMSFTRNRSKAVGQNTPLAASLGMTSGNSLFPQVPEIQVLGPMGSFRLFGSIGNDFSTLTDSYSWSDNISWIHGNHAIRGGGFALMQQLSREDTGSARGKIVFQTFSDFLVGLSAAQNLSPGGRSNVQTVQANQGVGPNGEVSYKYRAYYGSGYVQDDFKAHARLTLNLGVRWEYIRPAADTAGTMGNIWPSLLNQLPIPPLTGTLTGNTVAANYNPNTINPYTGKAFGALPAGVVVRPNGTAYQNSPPLATFAPRFGFAWQPHGSQGRASLRGGYGWFYQAPPISGTSVGTPSSSAPPFAQSFANTDASNGSSSFAQPFPASTLGWVLRTPTSQLSDKVMGPEFKVPLLHQWNVNAQIALTKALSLDLGYVGTYAVNLLTSRGLNQPVLASAAKPVNCGYDGAPADCITTSTSANAKLRVPIMGEAPTALGTTEFSGASSYHSLQATLRRRVSRGLTFQAAYTLSRARSNTGIYNDQTKAELDWGRSSFDRTHRLITNFDYALPSIGGAGGPAAALFNGWTLAGIVIMQSGVPLTLTDPAGGGVYGRAGTSTITLCPGATADGLATSGSVQSRLSGWIDKSAICAPVAVGSDGSTGYGNAGIALMDGPGQVNTDFSIGKTAVVGGFREGAFVAFRAEFYNALNHAQFSSPGTALGTVNFGVITQTSVAPRLIQFGIKYIF